MLVFICFMVLRAQVCIMSFMVGKSFEQIHGSGRKYSLRIHMVFRTIRKCEEDYREFLKERKY